MQQFDLKNLSRKEVDRIQVKFPPRVTAHEIILNSQGDKVETFTNQDSVEFIYPQLPAQGAFRIILKTPGEGIRRDELSVLHSKGLAQYALASGSSLSSAINWSTLFALLFYVTLVAYGMRTVFLDSWASRAEYNGEDVLRHGKPLYAGRDKWSEIRTKALESVATKAPFYDSDIQSQTYYKWLDRDKPTFLSVDEWDKFQTSAIKTLLSRVEALRNQAVSAKEVLDLLKIKRPLQCPPPKWEEAHARFEKAFLSIRLSNPYSDFRAMLSELKPDEVSNPVWAESQRTLARRLFQSLSEESALSFAPIEYLNRQDLTPLATEMADKLRKQAYERELAKLPSMLRDFEAEAFLKGPRPVWMSDSDYSDCKAKAERTLQATKEAALNRLVLSNLRLLLAGLPPDSKQLEQFDPELRMQLKKLDEDLRTAKEKLVTEAQTVSRDIKDVAEAKQKILKQLEILNRLFSDPASIDRVESYDNPFAPGNLETLKKVSVLLRSSESLKK